MKWLPRLLALFSLAAVIAVFAWERGELTSPGPLHPSHAAEPDLRGARGCPACHGDSGGRDLTSACAVCHREIAAQLTAQRGLHGQLQAALARRCGKCHLEHHGERSLVDARAFALAGIEAAESYDHRHVDFALHGAHTALACARCHRHADDPSLSKGDRRFLGLSQRCTACHEDQHHGAYGDDCASCHGQQGKFATAAAFQHSAAFPLVDGHAGKDCKACHASGEFTVAALMQNKPTAVRGCAACHESPHGEGGKSLRVRDASRCDACHGTREFKPTQFGARDHADHGFALLGAHATLACAQCHGKSGREPRWPAEQRPQPSDCASCHQHPHRDALLSAASGCAACHAEAAASFRAPHATLTAAQHAAAGFALTRPHDQLECSKCHGGDGAFRSRHPGRKADDCRACHDNPHRDEIARERACTDCHGKTHFLPTAYDVAAHARTSFALDGAHRAIACAGCHREPAAPDGRAARFKLRPLPKDCASCHRDVHDGRFDRKELPRRVGEREGCARCHDTTSFHGVHLSGAEHGKWTGFTLRGAHAQAKCTQCHVPDGAAAPGSPRQLGRAPQRCDECHIDPHAGQFREQGQTDCARCHGDTAFQPAQFDHDRHSRFKLDADHGKLACAACHKPWTTPSGGEVVRYKPLGTRCADCHAAGTEGKR